VQSAAPGPGGPDLVRSPVRLGSTGTHVCSRW
jgi:hypothetical protein